MLYRQAGIFHTHYASDRGLFPIPFERKAIIAILLIALAAPWLFSSLVLTSYLKPWLIWTAAVLGLNLILGWAGQFHFGYAAIMGIGAYASVHATRNGVPWEFRSSWAASQRPWWAWCLPLRRCASRACTWRCPRWPCSS